MGMEVKQRTSTLIGNQWRLVDDKTQIDGGYADAYSTLQSVLRFQVVRNQSFSTTVGYLPSGAVPTILRWFSGNSSNSSQTSSMIIGVDTTTNYFLTQTNLNAGATGLGVQQPQIPNAITAWNGSALATGVDHPVTASYAEAGTTSTTGGPWTVELLFYVPNESV